MFAKIYNSARNILSRSPSATTVPTESNEEKPRSQNSIADMVTTRAAASAQNTPSATPSAAGRKTKRGLGEDDTPAAAAKRRRNTKSGKKSQDDVVKEDAEEGPVTTASADDSTPNDPVVATVEIQPVVEQVRQSLSRKQTRRNESRYLQLRIFRTWNSTHQEHIVRRLFPFMPRLRRP
ncbi:hypothetical protein GQ43DRAFT_438079 [Delitschia confertaspora ATCC 74209]|uniref:Uncharacterized protein n=1 Tax=Delitschia confertaspora ATCC 74209 TaxID=1513339 RepID=A0A9P4JTS1_9PLEO|nr:hypothetical protein GQ43DRAFT_438079 [Delitschia confertaspora ATCC 74209]